MNILVVFLFTLHLNLSIFASISFVLHVMFYHGGCYQYLDCSCDKFSIVQNNLHELWSLLNFLLPEIFSSAETFDEWFQISGDNDQQEVVQQLHKVYPYYSLQHISV